MQTKPKLIYYILLSCLIIWVPTLFVDEVFSTFFKTELPEHEKLYLLAYLVAFCVGGLVISKKSKIQTALGGERRINVLSLRIMTSIVFLIFLVDVLPNFIQGVNRGVARTQYGLLGPLVTFGVLYLMPLMCLDGWINYEQKPTRANKFLFIFQILLTVLFGVFSGYKSSVLTFLLPLFIYVSRGKLTIKSFLYVFVTLIIAGVVTTFLTTDSSQITNPLLFLVHRVFFQSAYGLSAIYSKYANGGDLSYIWFELFGFHIMSLIGVNPELHMATAVSLEFYGPTEEALSRQANVTSSAFGEGVYLCGIRFAWMHGLLLGMALIFLLKKAILPLRRGSPSHRFWLIVFVWHGLFLLNGSSIFSLISLPTLLYLFVLRYIVYIRGGKRLSSSAKTVQFSSPSSPCNEGTCT